MLQLGAGHLVALCVLDVVKVLIFFFLFSGLCCGKATVAYTTPKRKKKEESAWLRGEGEKIRFIDLRFERELVLGKKFSYKVFPH